MRRLPLYKLIANTVLAHDNCAATGNTEGKVRHRETLEYIERNFLPSGSGIDNGTRIDFDQTTPEKLVLTFGFHHNYGVWTDHTATIRPSLVQEIEIRISGRDRNDIKEYLRDMFDYILARIVEWDEAAGCWKFAP